MPLVRGSSRSAISTNIAAEIRAGKPTRQAVAIAYRIAERHMKPHIVIKPSAPGYKFEVYMAGARGDGYRDEKGRLLVASGKRSTKVLAETAASRESAVYLKMHAKKGGK